MTEASAAPAASVAAAVADAKANSISEASANSSSADSKEAKSKVRLLCCGLGGGLDVVNALLPYFAAKNEGVDCLLGSVRPAPIDSVQNPVKTISDSCALLNKSSSFTRRGRYAEPRIAALLSSDSHEQQIVYFGRQFQTTDDARWRTQQSDVPRLRKSIEAAREALGITHLLFVDGVSVIFTVALPRR